MPPPSLESRLGAQVFNRIGIIAVLFGAALGLKLAIDNHWIGPVGRILIGLAAGAGIVVWSERFRSKGFSAFSYSLKAVGTGVLYLSLWAAFQLYHLLPPAAALGGMILVTAWNAYMAWAQDAELLAAYALAGGLATPLLLSTGGNHEIFLFTYLLTIDFATVLLVRVKPWQRLLLGAFPATVMYFIGWYSKFYAEPAFAVTALFIGLFFVVFASVPLDFSVYGENASSGHTRSLGSMATEILLPLGNAAFVSLALYSVLQDSDRHWFLPWMMLILAAVYLLITRLPQAPVPAAMHLSLAVVFLTIAIPLKASGHWITVAWLVEGVALLWVAARVASTHAKTVKGPSLANPSRLLRWLSAGSFVLGLGGLIAMPIWFGSGVVDSIFNRNVATALIGVAAFGGAAWLALRTRGGYRASWAAWSQFAFIAMVAVDVVAILLGLREIASSRYGIQPHAPFVSTDFGMALLCIAILFGVTYASRRISPDDENAPLWGQLSGGTVIVINLVALLSGVREIEALWPTSLSNLDAQLQQALAVSAFLMVYGAVLLAIGFWRRTAFIRWQALILLVFTIGKTFLYDMRNLSQGYRVMSFLGLGALLMTVSFAYQKDWLALRDTHSVDDQPTADTGSER
jgi:Predicted membrane protein